MLRNDRFYKGFHHFQGHFWGPSQASPSLYTASSQPAGRPGWPGAGWHCRGRVAVVSRSCRGLCQCPLGVGSEADETPVTKDFFLSIIGAHAGIWTAKNIFAIIIYYQLVRCARDAPKKIFYLSKNFLNQSKNPLRIVIK